MPVDPRLPARAWRALAKFLYDMECRQPTK
jgi:hypothetical protein